MLEVVAITQSDSVKFSAECSRWVERGFVVRSTNCYAYGHDSTIYEVYQAILVHEKSKDEQDN